MIVEVMCKVAETDCKRSHHKCKRATYISTDLSQKIGDHLLARMSTRYNDEIVLPDQIQAAIVSHNLQPAL